MLPKEVTWEGWKALVAEYLSGHDYAAINRRYWYGELRLSRLNKVYRYRLGYIFRGYSTIDSRGTYDELLSDNFAALTTLLGFMVVILSALQVGIETDRLSANARYQQVSYHN